MNDKEQVTWSIWLFRLQFSRLKVMTRGRAAGAPPRHGLDTKRSCGPKAGPQVTAWGRRRHAARTVELSRWGERPVKGRQGALIMGHRVYDTDCGSGPAP